MSYIIVLSTILFINTQVAMGSLLFKSSPENLKKGQLSNNNNVKSTIPKADTPNIILDKSSTEKNEEAIRLTLKKYELILSREKKIENIISIEFNKIICFIQLARIIRVKSGGKEIVKEESEYLKKALSTIDFILKQNNIPSKLISQLYFFQGNTFQDLGLKEKSRESFEKSITVYEESYFVPSLSLYLADLYYDDGDLNKAVNGYKRFYNRMTPVEKDLSSYKIAWILLNQSQLEKSIDMFLNLVNKSNSKSIVQDSILSLSVALGEMHDQNVVLRKIDQVEMLEEYRLKLLIGTYENFLRMPNLPKLKLWERILKTQTSQEEVLKLITSEIDNMDVSNKIVNEIVALRSIQKYLKINNEKVTKISSSYITALGLGLERLISKSLESYQKDKNQNSYIMLRLSIDSYLKLNIFNRQVEVAGLLLDLLNERAEESQLFSFCKEILTNPKYVSLRDKAKLIYLLEIEKKYLFDSKKNQQIFFNLIRSYLSSNKVEQWESVALKFYEYLVKENMDVEAEKVMSSLYKVNPNDNYFFKLITIKFEIKKCVEILPMLESKNNFDEKLLTYKRECNLILAQDSKNNANSFSVYEKNILEFIKLSEGSKKKAAIADYLISMESKITDDSNVELRKVLIKDFYTYRFEPEIFSVYQRAILNSMENGDFETARLYLKECSTSKVCISFKVLENQLNFLQILDASKELNNDIFNNLNSEFYGHISLTSPEVFVKNFNKKIISNKLDPLYLLVAARLSAIDWKEEQNKQLYNKVESLLSKEEKIITFYPLWSQLSKIKFPENEGRNKLKDQDIIILMKSVQKSRELLLSELSNYSLDDQKVILNKALDNELQMAKAIKSSPIPAGLDASKVAEYDKGLEELAEEFTLQSDSYKKLLINIEQQVLSKKDAPDFVSEGLYAPGNSGQWNFGKQTVYTDKVKLFIDRNQFVQALYYLDYLQSVSKISKEDYYLNRAGVLLISSSKRNKVLPMIKYVVNEFELNKQSSLFKKWREQGLKK